MMMSGDGLGASLSAALDRLALLLGPRLSRSEAVREQHGCGEGLREVVAPDAVAFAADTDEVAAIVGICAEYGLAVTPWGAGTSLEGQLQSPKGGVCIDLTGMDAIIEVNQEDLDCRVQAGVTREALNAHLRGSGMFFPLDPGANATIGGMAATRASGTNAVLYGTMRDVVLGLTVVLPTGEIIRTGGRARKSSAGYDLTGLFVGSEGTLGIITEVRLRLFGIPEDVVSAVCQFEELSSAVSVVISAIQMGVPVARVELLDSAQMAASISYSKLQSLEPKPTLFFEFHGSPASVGEQREQIEALAAEAQGGPIAWARAPEDRSKLWQARHDAYHAAKALRAGADVFVTDACVPISALATAIIETDVELRLEGVTATIVGHVGDGNFHVMLPFMASEPHERDRAERLSQSIARRAIRLGGTCTGEHGIGRHKREALIEEHGGSVDVMRRLKAAIDPHNLFNPGCIFAAGVGSIGTTGDPPRSRSAP